MEIVLLKQAREDRDYWKRTGNKQILKRITDLLAEMQKAAEQAKFIAAGENKGVTFDQLLHELD